MACTPPTPKFSKTCAFWESAAAACFELQLEGGGSGHSLNVLSYQPVIDGIWNIYTVPLSYFSGVDFSQISALRFWHPFSNADYASNRGHYIVADILIDDIHFE